MKPNSSPTNRAVDPVSSYTHHSVVFHAASQATRGSLTFPKYPVGWIVVDVHKPLADAFLADFHRAGWGTLVLMRNNAAAATDNTASLTDALGWLRGQAAFARQPIGMLGSTTGLEVLHTPALADLAGLVVYGSAASLLHYRMSRRKWIAPPDAFVARVAAPLFG